MRRADVGPFGKCGVGVSPEPGSGGELAGTGGCVARLTSGERQGIVAARVLRIVVEHLLCDPRRELPIARPPARCGRWTPARRAPVPSCPARAVPWWCGRPHAADCVPCPVHRCEERTRPAVAEMPAPPAPVHPTPPASPNARLVCSAACAKRPAARCTWPASMWPVARTSDTGCAASMFAAASASSSRPRLIRNSGQPRLL